MFVGVCVALHLLCMLSLPGLSLRGPCCSSRYSTHAQCTPMLPLPQLTTIGLVGQQAEVRRFRPGLDYTVAHYGLLTRDPQMDAVLCFVAGGEAGDGEAWESGEVGGYEAYLLADEDGEAAAVYSTVSRCCSGSWEARRQGHELPGPEPEHVHVKRGAATLGGSFGPPFPLRHRSCAGSGRRDGCAEPVPCRQHAQPGAAGRGPHAVCQVPELSGALQPLRHRRHLPA